MAPPALSFYSLYLKLAYTRLRGRGRVAPNHTTAQKLSYSVHNIHLTNKRQYSQMNYVDFYLIGKAGTGTSLCYSFYFIEIQIVVYLTKSGAYLCLYALSMLTEQTAV
jgi:hypothetical protein